MRDHKPRVSKSQEYKQVVGLLILVLAVAAVSFSLGVVVGKRSGSSLVQSDGASTRKQVEATQQLAKDGASPEDAPKVNLTFYDTLPKGEETPLGSGINPPPPTEDKPQPAATETPAAAKPEAVKQASPPEEKAKPPSMTSGEYVVQVASFRSEPDARTMQTRLLGKGHRAFLQRVDLAEKGVWTRVYIGFFNSKDAASRVAERLKTEDKLTPMVRRRQ